LRDSKFHIRIKPPINYTCSLWRSSVLMPAGWSPVEPVEHTVDVDRLLLIDPSLPASNTFYRVRVAPSAAIRR